MALVLFTRSTALNFGLENIKIACRLIAVKHLKRSIQLKFKHHNLIADVLIITERSVLPFSTEVYYKRVCLQCKNVDF